MCALQWQRCVDKAEEAFAAMPDDKVVRVRYEDFVCNPVQELARILKFIGKEVERNEISRAVRNVSPHNIGKGRRELAPPPPSGRGRNWGTRAERAGGSSWSPRPS